MKYIKILAFIIGVSASLYGIIDNCFIKVDYITLGNELSYFTYQSNLFADVIILLSIFTKFSNSKLFSYFRYGSVLYMIVTGLVYNIMLADAEAFQYPSIIIHCLFPLYVLIDFVIDRPIVRPSFLKTLVFVIYPLIYFAYSLIRGPFVNWWPYDFVNPNVSSPLTMLYYAIGILGGLLLFANLLKLLAKPKP
jgi:hypothetical protein